VSKSQKYLDELFSDKLKFEEEVLFVKCDEDRKEVMTLLCKEVCSEHYLASELNFLKLKSLNQLSFKSVSITITQLIMLELVSVLKEKNFTKTEIENIKKNKSALKFIYELTQTYLRRFSDILYKEVVESFFELIGIADKPENLKKIVLEVISGTKDKTSLLEMPESGQILYKPEQAWMRVRQAKDDKSRQAKVFQLEISRLVKRVDELRLNISSIVAAKSFGVEEAKNISAKLLLDMFTEDEVKLQNKTAMFLFIPSSNIIEILYQTALTSKFKTKNNSEKNDFAKIAEFFKKCKKINTPKYIDEKLEEFKHELELKSASYKDQNLKLQNIRDKSLDSFDITLKKVKIAMVYNLQHM